MFAMSCAVFRRSKRRSSASSRANAWITRTPVRSSCRTDKVCAIRSRRVRYARFERRRNQTLAAMTGGNAIAHTSASFGER